MTTHTSITPSKTSKVRTFVMWHANYRDTKKSTLHANDLRYEAKTPFYDKGIVLVLYISKVCCRLLVVAHEYAHYQQSEPFRFSSILMHN